jgi:hypothetical protein
VAQGRVPATWVPAGGSTALGSFIGATPGYGNDNKMTSFSHSARWLPSVGSADNPGKSGPVEPVRIGAYLHSAHELYRVEGLTGERALIEDCRSGDLINVSFSELLALEPVRAAGAPD